MPSLEEALASNTAALNRLADAMEKGGGGASSGGTTAAASGKTGGAKGGAKPKNTVDQMRAAVMQVKNEIGEEEAKALIAKHAGQGKKLADLANLPAKFDAVVAEAEELIANAGGGEGEAEEEI